MDPQDHFPGPPFEGQPQLLAALGTLGMRASVDMQV